MPVNFTYLPKQRLALSVYWGAGGTPEVIAVRSARIKDPRLREAVASVVDATAITDISTRTQEAEELAKFAAEKDPLAALPTAIVASKDSVHGVSMLFEMFLTANKPDAKVRVFRTWAEASKFLKMDLTAAQDKAAEIRKGRSLL